VYGEQFGPSFGGNVWDKEGVAPTLKTGASASQQFVIVDEPVCLNSKGGRVGKQIAGTLTTSSEMAVVVPSFVNGDICKTVRASGHGSVDRHSWDMVAVQEPINPMPDGMWRIRKLTPKECWRLMGFDDTDFEKAEAVNSNTQLYKQAGNSIVVDVIEHLYKELAKAQIEGFK
jgi:DNA (cytosine-5)-methyltransferase 1